MQPRKRIAADAMECDGEIEGLVDFKKERVPWLRRSVMRHRVHRAGIERSDPSADSNGWLRQGASAEASGSLGSVA